VVHSTYSTMRKYVLGSLGPAISSIYRAVRYSIFDDHSSQFVVLCVQQRLILADYSTHFAVRSMLIACFCPRLVACCMLHWLAARCILHIVRCVLPVAAYALHAACCASWKTYARCKSALNTTSRRAQSAEHKAQ
jgi:hypothetical protein